MHSKISSLFGLQMDTFVSRKISLENIDWNFLGFLRIVFKICVTCQLLFFILRLLWVQYSQLRGNNSNFLLGRLHWLELLFDIFNILAVFRVHFLMKQLPNYSWSILPLSWYFVFILKPRQSFLLLIIGSFWDRLLWYFVNSDRASFRL